MNVESGIMLLGAVLGGRNTDMVSSDSFTTMVMLFSF